MVQLEVSLLERRDQTFSSKSQDEQALAVTLMEPEARSQVEQIVGKVLEADRNAQDMRQT